MIILKRIGVLLVSALLLCSITSAASSPFKQNAMQNPSYKDHTLSFEVPQNWSVIKDHKEGNDTQVVLSEGTNSIRIDLIKHPGINKLIGDYLDHVLNSELASLSLKAELASLSYKSNDPNNEAWKSAYTQFPWYSNEAVCCYYELNIIHPIDSDGPVSGISVNPDGVKYPGIYTNADSHHGINEWVIAWTKPSYDDEIIGVHSLFKGDYREIKVEWKGSNRHYSMPEPLWTVLNTLNRGDKLLTKPNTSSSLAELV